MLKLIRKLLMKLPSINALVLDYNQRRKKAQHRERWTALMSSGYTVRNAKPEKLGPRDTFGIVTLEEWRGGRVVDRETMILNSTNWGGTKL